MKCDKCNIDLEMLPVNLSYLEFSFTEKLPCCPKCGMVFISEELVDGKITELEESFEEK